MGMAGTESGARTDRERKEWSGRADLNCRPSEPHSDALTRLRYAPLLSQKSKIKSQKYRLKIKNEIT
jgi:hypothetical protein